VKYKEYLNESRRCNDVRNILTNTYKNLRFNISENKGNIQIEWNFNETHLHPHIDHKNGDIECKGELLPDVASIINTLQQNNIIPKRYMTYSNLAKLDLEY
jgi:hypothetical protein